MFIGCELSVTKAGKPYGLREKPGPTVRKDAYYWLPILGLWTGCRVEEMDAARVADIKQEDGIWFLDLRDRADLKTDDASPRAISDGVAQLLRRALGPGEGVRTREKCEIVAIANSPGRAAPSEDQGQAWPIQAFAELNSRARALTIQRIVRVASPNLQTLNRAQSGLSEF
jgi:hypothetical protein